MRAIEFAAAATPVAAGLPIEAPWPVVLVIALSGPVVLLVLGVLKFIENIIAIRKTPDRQVPSLMRWIRSRPARRGTSPSGGE